MSTVINIPNTKPVVKKPPKLGSPMRRTKKECKKINKLIPLDATNNVEIPSVMAFQHPSTNTEVLENDVLLYDKALEEELTKYHYIPINTILMQDRQGNTKNKYIKAVNQMGQKVYIQIDDDYKNFDTDLTLVETKQGSIIPYSIKNGAMKMAGMDVCGVVFEGQDWNMCMLENVVHDEDENVTVMESNFTVLEERPDTAIVENYGCHMSYPVVKLSEIRVNNALVMEGANCVTRKLRNASFKAYSDDMINTQASIACLSNAYNELFDIFERDSTKLMETLNTLEEYNAYYMTNPPSTECDMKKSNIIVHNLRLRNDYIANLICAMKEVSEYKTQIDQLSINISEFKDFFEEQFAGLDLANNTC